MPGRIQALTSFVVSEIIEADFATDCDRTTLKPDDHLTIPCGQGARRRYDLLAAT
ncbi:hypothetical protein [Nostoc sp.]|uniref:hypothetical protein n=1 Tax=Nostoc sp. TaxID=1180 RepID=UPI002D7874F6|nr:hypothetical protein [Nostoc sp.]